ncbi:SCO2322 family protein [Streptomyces sp. NPDC054796]
MRTRSPHARRALPALFAGLLAFTVGQAPSAHAAPAAKDGYRYWSFWEQDGKGSSWSYATQGPSVLRPADGDVLGFRFAVSEDSKDAATPRGTAAFDAVCGDTDAKSGSKRVALSIDFGTAADAPGGEQPPKARTACARVGEGATAAEALASVAEPLRYNSDSLLCAIDGYPAKGCGEQTSGDGDGAGDEAARDSGDDEGGEGLSTGLGVAAGIATVAALGAAALWQARRRRT